MMVQDWERVKELVATALESDPQERKALLSQLSSEAPTIAELVARLVASHDNAGDFLNRPFVLEPEFLDDVEADQRFFPGEVACGRFEVVRLIGKGGMGEVYEAWDRELDDHVALKTLRFEVSTHELFTARFRKEIQLARKVTHPNVCRIFDSFKHQIGAETYVSVLSMELLQGQTLADYLAVKGKLTVAEAWPIAQQVVDGLQAVHEAGIIHRDLKPSNLVLIPDGDGFRVKITDFGIAGRLPDDPSQPALSQASRMLGTPDYMAPEQLENGQATIRSDIYSLGLVLYEMVTGAKPFAGDGAWKRLHEPPRPPKKTSPSLPEHWNKVILCCLERKPEYRFADIDTLGGILTAEATTVHLPPKPLATRIRAWTRSRWAMIASSVALMALLLFALRFYQVKPQLEEGATVVFPEIENTTSDQELEGVTDLMRNQLEQSPNVMLLERSQMRSQLQQMGQPTDSPVPDETLREMAWRAGARLLLLGTLSRVANGYLLTMRAEEVPAKPTDKWRQWEKNFLAGNKDKIFDITQQACQWFRNLVEREPLASGGRDTLPQSTTTSSWSALLLFSQAERLKAVGQTREAIQLLEQSTQIDPDFSLAYMRLGDLYVSLKDEKNGFSNWQRALDTLQRRKVTQKEELRIKGLFAQDSGNWKISLDPLKTFERLYPHEYLPSFYLASTLARMNQLDDALAKSREAEARQPLAYAPIAQEARLDMVLGKINDAEDAIRRLRAIGRQDSADSIEVGLGLLRGDLSRSMAALDRLRQTSDPLFKSKSFSLRAAFLAELRRFAEAVQALQEGIAFDSANGLDFNEADKWAALAYLQLRNGARLACRKAALQAIKKEKGRLHLLQAGTLLARAGFVADARAVLRQFDSWPSFPLVDEAKHQIRGEISLAEGRPDDALTEMGQAEKVDVPNGFHEYLTRALESAGKKQDALAMYRHIAESPAQVWQAPDFEYPGFWRDMAEQYASRQADPNDPVLQQAQKHSLKLAN